MVDGSLKIGPSINDCCTEKMYTIVKIDLLEKEKLCFRCGEATHFSKMISRTHDAKG